MPGKKILVIRLSSIGDIVLCTPAIRCIASQTQAEVHWLVKRSFSGVLAGNPYITRTWIYEEVLEDPRKLKAEGFDAVFDMHCNLRTRRLRSGLGAQVLTFDKINRSKWLMVNFKWPKLPDKHIVDRYFEALKAWNISYDGKGLDFFVQEECDISLPEGFVAVVMGAAHATKQMPIRVLIDLIAKISAPVVLVGGPGDRALGEAVVKALEKDIINTAGQCSIHGSADILNKAVRVITPDTGMMHIAAALGKSMDVVWGNTIPEFGMYPFLPEGKEGSYRNHQVKLKCRPCSKIGYESCPKGHFRCMHMQDTRAIAEGRTS
jgi:ADP-heptose:LPS heptosyltransferase